MPEESSYDITPEGALTNLGTTGSLEPPTDASHVNGHTTENPTNGHTTNGVAAGPNGHVTSTPVNPAPRISASKLRNKRAHAPNNPDAEGGGSRTQTVIPVQMPNKQWWVRCHPDPAMTVPVDILVVNADGHDKLYFLDPTVGFPDELDRFVCEARITRSITSTGTEFFLLAKQSAKSPKDSTRAVVNEARKRWIRVSWNPTAKGYDIESARSLRREPVWSATTLDELLEKAFGDNYIDRADHFVVNNLLYP